MDSNHSISSFFYFLAVAEKAPRKVLASSSGGGGSSRSASTPKSGKPLIRTTPDNIAVGHAWLFLTFKPSLIFALPKCSRDV